MTYIFTAKNTDMLLINYKTNIFLFIFFLIKFLNNFSIFNLVKYFNYNIMLDYSYSFKLKNKIPYKPYSSSPHKLPNKFEYSSNDHATEVMEKLIDLHQDMMVYLFFFLVLIV